MRHARATGTHHDAELTPDGERQADEVGSRLRAAGLVPDLVVCSDARRTRATADGVLAGLGATPPVEAESALYGASPDTTLELVTMTEPAVGTLLVIGHNPSMALLATGFLDDAPDSFPPATVVVVELEVEWLYAAPGTGRGRLLV
ncbi:histidine phosphatase family protein [Spiractinospora alimapuensis]|nr:histidine phosphatase family protein [Spiractinospora alimapuensis]